MASTHKTEQLGLNRWIGTDKPKRSDWNTDNDKVDVAFGQLAGTLAAHEKVVGHVTAAERAKWNEGQSFAMTSYLGNGGATRQIVLGKAPKLGLIFAVGKPPTAAAPGVQCYSGFLSPQGCSDGITLTANGFTVYHQKVPDPSGMSLYLNQENVTYLCFYWV